MRVISQDEAITTLVGAMGDDSLALFAGAGISMSAPSSCPSWPSLTHSYISAAVAVARIEGSDTLSPLLESLPEAMSSAFRRPEHTFQVLHDIVGDDVFDGLALLRTGEPNANHFLIGGYLWLGGLRAVVTTNFDEHIEQVVALYESHGGSPSSLPLVALRGKTPLPTTRHSECRLLWSIHGSLSDSSSIVASVSSTGRSLSAEAAGLLRDVIDHNTLLVVGYSGNDEDITQVLYSPDTIRNARAIIWQVMDSTHLRPGSVPATLAALYGDRFCAVVTTAEDLFSWILDPLVIGAPDSVTEYTDAVTQLRQQWRLLLPRTMTREALAAFEMEFDKEFKTLGREGRTRVDHDAPGSVTTRVSYVQLVLALLEGPAGNAVVGQDVAASLIAGYRAYLVSVREKAPLAVLQRYPTYTARLVIANLLLSAECYSETTDVAELGLEEISTESRLQDSELWDLDPVESRDSWQKECYRRLGATKAIALVCDGRPKEALNQVQFAQSLLVPALTSGDIHLARSVEMALLAETWALARTTDRSGDDVIDASIERLRTLERTLSTIGAMPLVQSFRGEYDRDVLRMDLRRGEGKKVTSMWREFFETAVSAGDVLRVTLLKAARAELRLEGLSTEAALAEYEACYQSLMGLGATHQLLRLCTRVAAVSDGAQRGRWLERYSAHRDGFLKSVPPSLRDRMQCLVDGGLELEG